MLSSNELKEICTKFPCRDSVIRQLDSLYSLPEGSPPTCVVYGPPATGKSSIIKYFLETIDVPHILVRVRECVTARHLLEHTLASCVSTVGDETIQDCDESIINRCENPNALAVHLQKLFKDRAHFVLVFDGIDNQRENSPTMLPALARLGYLIPNLSVIFIVSFISPLLLHLAGVPYILFQAYNWEEILRIVTVSPLSIMLSSGTESGQRLTEAATQDDGWVWSRYCTALWESFGRSTARDLVSFRQLADKLWRPFVSSIQDGTYGIRDFSKLMIAKRQLFQSENALRHNFILKCGGPTPKLTTKVSHKLPYYSKYILCAAYLASFSPPRKDVLLFVKKTEKKKRRKGRTLTGRVRKYRKMSRQLLMASPFSIDRLLAILHSIVPHSIPLSADIYSQISTLSAIRLLVRNIGVGADVLDPSVKWRANCTWDYVHELGRSIDFDMNDYIDHSGKRSAHV